MRGGRKVAMEITRANMAAPVRIIKRVVSVNFFLVFDLFFMVTPSFCKKFVSFILSYFKRKVKEKGREIGRKEKL